MKNFFKNILTQLLWFQVKRLRLKHNPVVVAVAGSVGKTGTKTAIATVLTRHLKVRWQDGNYNDLTSVPLIFFGKKAPHPLNFLAWAWILLSAETQIQGSYPYQMVVIELGIDRPGDMSAFKKYLHVDYGVLTAIAPEHMANFTDLDAVADEELMLAEIADHILVATDAVANVYRQKLVDPITYGFTQADATVEAKPLTQNFTRPLVITVKDKTQYSLETKLVGKQNLPALVVAAQLGNLLELKKTEVIDGLSRVKASPGRMPLLRGKDGSIIIDDSYNASPEAVKAALDTLYEMKAKSKIAILGQMNELGNHSKALHQDIGSYCNPKQLDLVVTVGEDANKYLATAAEDKGCKVMRCPGPAHAADIVWPLLKPGTLVLVKGSQNGVFVEEAIKELLHDPQDAKKLVRQSRYWLKLKERQFEALS